MDRIDFPIERINQFFETHVFEITTHPTHDAGHSMTTNVKVKLTGVEDYISIGEKKPHVEYTLYILKSNPESDMWNSMYSSVYGSDIPISTTDNYYYQLRSSTSHLLNNFLRYFGVNKDVICTRVINEVDAMKLT